MKTLLSSVAIIFFASVAVSSAAGEKDAMIDKEKAAWQSFQDKKSDVFRKVFADDYRGVYGDGMKTVEQEVAALGKSDLKSFSFSDMTVSLPDKDTALLTYKVTQQMTQDGKDVSGTYTRHIKVDEPLDRHIRFPVRGMESEFLSRRFALEQNAAVLRGAIFDHGDQLHVSPNSKRQDNR